MWGMVGEILRDEVHGKMEKVPKFHSYISINFDFNNYFYPVLFVAYFYSPQHYFSLQQQ